MSLLVAGGPSRRCSSVGSESVSVSNSASTRHRHTETLQCSFKTVIYNKYTSYIYISYTDFNTSDRTAV